MLTAPYSARPRQYLIESLPDGYGFAFNFEEPAGVKLLNPVLYSRLRTGLNVTGVLDDNDPMRKALVDLSTNSRPIALPRLYVWLHIVNGCTFSCYYCYIPHLNRKIAVDEIKKHSLKAETIHPLLSNLAGYCNEYEIAELRIIFAGGEPTLNVPLIETFCSEAMKQSFGFAISFGIISNGSFDFQELLPLLHRYKMRISLSADGFEDSHDRTRFEMTNGRKVGSWKIIFNNVKMLLASDIQPYFLYTVTPHNYGDIQNFASFVHGMGLGFRLSLVRERNTPSLEIQAAVAQELRRVYQSLAETLDPSIPIFRDAAFAEWNLYQKKYSPCSSCRHYFAIDSKGRVGSCQMRLDRTYGDATTEPFSQIVARVHADSDNQALNNPTRREGSCANCEFFHVCAGGCPQHTLRATGSMDNPSPWCHVYGSVMLGYIRAIARQLQRAVVSRTRQAGFKCA